MVAQSNPYLVALDTWVLAPMPLCDTLLRLANDSALNIPKWSREIIGELRSTLERMGQTPERAERRMAAMKPRFVAAMRNDPKDRHVLAAAVRCGAHAIVTHNVKHFRPEATKP
jgi:predicted nucleic acid-binding protein